jgi:hypothetical protein
MLFTKFNPRTILLLISITTIAVVRVVSNFDEEISPLANFSPVGAMALFGGAYFNRQWKAFIFPLLMLFLSDVVLQQTVFKAYGNGILYGGWYWVYGVFALMTFAGRWLLKKITIKTFIVSVLVSVVIHWIVTDIGVWYGSKIFSQNFGGYVDCLVAAIPYELRFLTGTFVYGVILFGLFEWMEAHTIQNKALSGDKDALNYSRRSLVPRDDKQ